MEVITHVYLYNNLIVLYERLFNVLFDESVDCKLIKSTTLDVKMQNWNKINATICFNYL